MSLPPKQHPAHGVRSELLSKTTQMFHGPRPRWQGTHGCYGGTPTTCISADSMFSTSSLIIWFRVAPDRAVSGRRVGSRFADMRFITLMELDFS